MPLEALEKIAERAASRPRRRPNADGHSPTGSSDSAATGPTGRPQGLSELQAAG